MLNYVNKSWSIFQHKKPKNDQHSPHPHAKPDYGAKIQYAPPSTTSNIKESKIIYCKNFIGTFLFYACAIDSTVLTSVRYISTHIFTAQWDNINNCINSFLDYAATHPNSKVMYHKINMHIWVRIDSSYLDEPKAISCSGGYH